MIETKAQTTTSMTIRYQLTVDDQIAINYFYNTKSSIAQKKIRNMKILYAFALLPCIFIITFVMTKIFIIATIISLCFGLLIYKFTETAVIIRANKNTRKMYELDKNKALYQETTLTISQEYIETISSLAEGRMKWSLVEKIAIEEDYIFIFVSENGAIIIPNRAFQNQAQRREFIELINRYHAVKYA